VKLPQRSAILAGVALAAVVAFASWRPRLEPRPVARIRLAGGTFVQGHDDGERADEGPAHEVSVAPFELDATLVTRADFARFVERTGFVTTAEQLGYGLVAEEGMLDWEWQPAPHGTWRRPFLTDTEDTRAFFRDDAPVVMVSFRDAVAYCADEGARLPTEAEWEYAMRAGTSGTRYPWGDDAIREETGGHLGLNFWQGSSHEHNRRDDGFVYVSPVRAFPPNAWGLYDPVGNVWQWTADRYDAHAYEAAAAPRDPPPPGPARRVLRGGSWWCGACTCEGNGLFYRGKAEERAPFNNNGFRCARSLGLGPGPGGGGAGVAVN
jgi:formylglycine-generating enzyme required for sulfatase activity